MLDDSASAATKRRELRRSLRRARRELDAIEREQADAAICGRIRRIGAFRRARRVGIYFAFDGEPDLARLFASCSRQGKTLYAPVISNDMMRFADLSAARDLQRNKFGILEPVPCQLIDERSLDLVLTPLVGFDDDGNRLGVGKAYYDRCFGFLSGRRYWRRPKLLGVGYSVQRMANYQPARWDVPLWGVVTELSLTVFRGDTDGLLVTED
jgi:5-formyltetrahydrofolate cyclo-ligase